MPPPPREKRPTIRAVTATRVSRLFRIVTALASGPRSRAVLLRKLSLSQRGFYRDLELLRAVGIPVVSGDGRYSLGVTGQAALDRLPFPDPRLTLGEAQRLARGTTAAHKSLQKQIRVITAARAAKAP